MSKLARAKGKLNSDLPSLIKEYLRTDDLDEKATIRSKVSKFYLAQFDYMVSLLSFIEHSKNLSLKSGHRRHLRY